jgi:hypothetical protein
MKKSIEELENSVWPEPEWDSHLVTECNRLKKKPIDEFTVEDLRIMIGQNTGTEHLLPIAVDVIEKNPWAEGVY